MSTRRRGGSWQEEVAKGFSRFFSKSSSQEKEDDSDKPSASDEQERADRGFSRLFFRASSQEKKEGQEKLPTGNGTVEEQEKVSQSPSKVLSRASSQDSKEESEDAPNQATKEEPGKAKVFSRLFSRGSSQEEEDSKDASEESDSQGNQNLYVTTNKDENTSSQDPVQSSQHQYMVADVQNISISSKEEKSTDECKDEDDLTLDIKSHDPEKQSKENFFHFIGNLFHFSSKSSVGNTKQAPASQELCKETEDVSIKHDMDEGGSNQQQNTDEGASNQEQNTDEGGSNQEENMDIGGSNQKQILDELSASSEVKKQTSRNKHESLVANNMEKPSEVIESTHEQIPTDSQKQNGYNQEPPAITYGTYRGSRRIRKLLKRRPDVNSPISEKEETTDRDTTTISDCEKENTNSIIQLDKKDPAPDLPRDSEVESPPLKILKEVKNEPWVEEKLSNDKMVSNIHIEKYTHGDHVTVANFSQIPDFSGFVMDSDVSSSEVSFEHESAKKEPLPDLQRNSVPPLKFCKELNFQPRVEENVNNTDELVKTLPNMDVKLDHDKPILDSNMIPNSLDCQFTSKNNPVCSHYNEKENQTCIETQVQPQINPETENSTTKDNDTKSNEIELSSYANVKLRPNDPILVVKLPEVHNHTDLEMNKNPCSSDGSEYIQNNETVKAPPDLAEEANSSFQQTNQITSNFDIIRNPIPTGISSESVKNAKMPTSVSPTVAIIKSDGGAGFKSNYEYVSDLFLNDDKPQGDITYNNEPVTDNSLNNICSFSQDESQGQVTVQDLSPDLSDKRQSHSPTILSDAPSSPTLCADVTCDSPLPVSDGMDSGIVSPQAYTPDENILVKISPTALHNITTFTPVVTNYEQELSITGFVESDRIMNENHATVEKLSSKGKHFPKLEGAEVLNRMNEVHTSDSHIAVGDKFVTNSSGDVALERSSLHLPLVTVEKAIETPKPFNSEDVYLTKVLVKSVDVKEVKIAPYNFQSEIISVARLESPSFEPEFICLPNISPSTVNSGDNRDLQISKQPVQNRNLDKAEHHPSSIKPEDIIMNKIPNVASDLLEPATLTHISEKEKDKCALDISLSGSNSENLQAADVPSSLDKHENDMLTKMKSESQLKKLNHSNKCKTIAVDSITNLTNDCAALKPTDPIIEHESLVMVDRSPDVYKENIKNNNQTKPANGNFLDISSQFFKSKNETANMTSHSSFSRLECNDGDSVKNSRDLEMDLKVIHGEPRESDDVLYCPSAADNISTSSEVNGSYPAKPTHCTTPNAQQDIILPGKTHPESPHSLRQKTDDIICSVLDSALDEACTEQKENVPQTCENNLSIIIPDVTEVKLTKHKPQKNTLPQTSAASEDVRLHSVLADVPCENILFDYPGSNDLFVSMAQDIVNEIVVSAKQKVAVDSLQNELNRNLTDNETMQSIDLGNKSVALSEVMGKTVHNTTKSCDSSLSLDVEGHSYNPQYLPSYETNSNEVLPAELFQSKRATNQKYNPSFSNKVNSAGFANDTVDRSDTILTSYVDSNTFTNTHGGPVLQTTNGPDGSNKNPITTITNTPIGTLLEDNVKMQEDVDNKNRIFNEVENVDFDKQINNPLNFIKMKCLGVEQISNTSCEILEDNIKNPAYDDFSEPLWFQLYNSHFTAVSECEDHPADVVTNTSDNDYQDSFLSIQAKRVRIYPLSLSPIYEDDSASEDILSPSFSPKRSEGTASNNTNDHTSILSLLQSVSDRLKETDRRQDGDEMSYENCFLTLDSEPMSGADQLHKETIATPNSKLSPPDIHLMGESLLPEQKTPAECTLPEITKLHSLFMSKSNTETRPLPGLGRQSFLLHMTKESSIYNQKSGKETKSPHTSENENLPTTKSVVSSLNSAGEATLPLPPINEYSVIKITGTSDSPPTNEPSVLKITGTSPPTNEQSSLNKTVTSPSISTNEPSSLNMISTSLPASMKDEPSTLNMTSTSLPASMKDEPSTLTITFTSLPASSKAEPSTLNMTSTSLPASTKDEPSTVNITSTSLLASSQDDPSTLNMSSTSLPASTKDEPSTVNITSTSLLASSQDEPSTLNMTSTSLLASSKDEPSTLNMSSTSLPVSMKDEPSTLNMTSTSLPASTKDEPSTLNMSSTSLPASTKDEPSTVNITSTSLLASSQDEPSSLNMSSTSLPASTKDEPSTVNITSTSLLASSQDEPSTLNMTSTSLLASSKDEPSTLNMSSTSLPVSMKDEPSTLNMTSTSLPASTKDEPSTLNMTSTSLPASTKDEPSTLNMSSTSLPAPTKDEPSTLTITSTSLPASSKAEPSSLNMRSTSLPASMKDEHSTLNMTSTSLPASTKDEPSSVNITSTSLLASLQDEPSTLNMTSTSLLASSKDEPSTLNMSSTSLPASTKDEPSTVNITSTSLLASSQDEPSTLNMTSTSLLASSKDEPSTLNMSSTSLPASTKDEPSTVNITSTSLLASSQDEPSTLNMTSTSFLASSKDEPSTLNMSSTSLPASMKDEPSTLNMTSTSIPASTKDEPSTLNMSSTSLPAPTKDEPSTLNIMAISNSAPTNHKSSTLNMMAILPSDPRNDEPSTSNIMLTSPPASKNDERSTLKMTTEPSLPIQKSDTDNKSRLASRSVYYQYFNDTHGYADKKENKRSPIEERLPSYRNDGSQKTQTPLMSAVDLNSLKFNPRPGKVIFSDIIDTDNKIEFNDDVLDATSWIFPNGVNIRVIRGCWVLYEQPSFEGQMRVLEEGEAALKHLWDPPADTMTIGSLKRIAKDGRIPEVLLYKHLLSATSGRPIAFHTEIPSLDSLTKGILHSLTVKSGVWLAYTDPQYCGDVTVLEEGCELSPVQDCGIQSVRPLKMGGLKVQMPSDPKIILYQKPHFEGWSKELTEHVYSLKTLLSEGGDQDIGSIRVLGGIWVGYENERYKGHQYLLEEGEYEDWRAWGGFSSTLQSIRYLQADFLETSVTLFESDVEDGKVIDVLNKGIHDLEQAAYSTETSSIHVKKGMWVAYQQKHFCGEQYILEKGRYKSFLDWGGTSNTILSIRPVLLEPLGKNDPKHMIKAFSNGNFQGPSVDFTEEVSDFQSFMPSSFKVLRGCWLLYYQTDASENVCVLEEGLYPDMVSCGCPAAVITCTRLKPIDYVFAEPSISLFALDSCEGREMNFEEAVNSVLSKDLHFYTQSVWIRNGLWIAYEGANFLGRQMLLEPKQILNWAEFSGWKAIDSLRPLKQPPVYFRIRNRHKDKYLTVTGKLTDARATFVGISSSNGQSTQIWYFCRGLVKSKANNSCLDVIGGKNTPGSKVSLWTEHGKPRQKWKIGKDGTITSYLSDDLVLDLKGGKNYDQNQVVVNHVQDKELTQRWDIEIL